MSDYPEQWLADMLALRTYLDSTCLGIGVPEKPPPRNDHTMDWLLILLLHGIITFVIAVPPPTPLGAKLHPICFPIRPHCLRPRVDECREAMSVMVFADAGYPYIFGRPEIVVDTPRSFIVPHSWSSLPRNCVVKIDVTDPRATEEVTLKSLTAPAEVVIHKCILAGNGCGGSILVGKSRMMELMLAYYTADEIKSGISDLRLNRTFMTHTDA
ncbi:MAG: hypothetical protein L6R39_007656 [Caloplaca ligustica]|nr:MAG: hypothetical protein L6R39_007656 [Caloplaca ligustica]